MSKQSEPTNPFDPFTAWRTGRDAYVDVWSKAMLDLVSTEAFSAAMGRSLDTYLSLSNPVRKLMETTMEQVLSQLNMPSRADVTGLAERLSDIEMRLDDLDAKLDALQDSVKAGGASAAVEATAPRAAEDTPSTRRRGGKNGA